MVEALFSFPHLLRYFAQLIIEFHTDQSSNLDLGLKFCKGRYLLEFGLLQNLN